mgnify:CR=1 FL=1
MARCEYHSESSTCPGKRWKLYGDGLGHEQATPEALSQQQSSQVLLGEFDELVITDHMAAAMPSWHPCHLQGLEDVVPDVVASLRMHLDWDDSERRFRTVQPLFSCMVAFERDAKHNDDDNNGANGHSSSGLHIAYDAATVQGNPILQWVCSQESRPHDTTTTNDDDVATALERWILVSTAEFAQSCLQSEGMSRKVSSRQSSAADAGTKGTTGPNDTSKKAKESVEYIPQTDEYLRSDPAQIMCDEFLKLVTENHKAKGETHVLPKIAFRKCQRWGAAYMAPSSNQEDYQRLTSILQSHECSHHITLCGDYLHNVLSEEYASRVDKETGTYSHAIQDAALSGIDAAKRIAGRIKSSTTTA